MFLGHFAVGLAGKAAAPKPSLGTLFLAAQFLDLLWPTLLMLNLEQAMISPEPGVLVPLKFTNYPISHSLLLVLGWGLLFGLVYWLIKKDTRSAVILGLLVVSHWFIDLIVHVPDLPLYPGDAPMLGLGLWTSTIATIALEILLFIVGLWLYLKTTKAKNKTGNYSFWALVVFLVVIYFMNLFGPVPPNMEAVAWGGQMQWLLVIWAYWADHNRETINYSASDHQTIAPAA
jgi:FtsH-binding integral membrane protein